MKKCAKTGKICYPYRKDAQAAITQIFLSRDVVGALSLYRCPFCELWHLTSHYNSWRGKQFSNRKEYEALTRLFL